MTTKELEQLLEGGTETPRIEYKGPCEWNVNLFAKDILAMANVENGGWIVVGMEEIPGGYRRVGVSEKQSQSFAIDNMRDQFSKFADPSVNFSVHVSLDENGVTFVVIQVEEFQEIPVICIKASELAGTKAPVIYYRNTDKKVESGPVSNYHDLRDIIERSAIKMRAHWRKLGLELSESFEKQLESEISELK